MIIFIAENIGTIAVGLVLLGIVMAIIIKMLRDNRKGKHLGSDCVACPKSSYCNTK
jgi:hypothetical protein